MIDKYRAKLTPEQDRVLREKGTEAPFSGKLLHNNKSGVYTCVACGSQLFTSENKFDSNQPGLMGWPSFSELVDDKKLS